MILAGDDFFLDQYAAPAAVDGIFAFRCTSHAFIPSERTAARCHKGPAETMALFGPPSICSAIFFPYICIGKPAWGAAGHLQNGRDFPE